MEISRTTIFYGMLVCSCTLSAFLVISFDGFLLYLKGIRLFNEKFDKLESKYERFSFHTFEIFRAIIVVSCLLGILIYIKGGI